MATYPRISVQCRALDRSLESMEVEVKMRLPDAESHERVASLLAGSHEAVHAQENVFFDGKDGELSSRRAVLRLRFYNGDEKCVASYKGQAVIVDGISRAEEVEEDLDVAVGRACVGEPWRLAQLDCALLRNIVNNFACRDFVCLGGFRNLRNVYTWEGHKIELDETHFDFGTSYEIEVESTEPERVKELLENFLSRHNIPYSYSTASKFGIFRSGKLPQI